MRVGLVTYGLDRASGGIGRYTQELLRALPNTGVALTRLQAGRAVNAEGSVNLIGARLLPGLLTVGQVEIARLSRRHNLDVIHDPTGTIPLFLTKARSVTTIHDVVPRIYPHTSSRLDWLIYRLWLPLAVQRVDAVITDSYSSRKDIAHFLRVSQQKITVVPCAASASYRTLGPDVVTSVLDRYGIRFPYILYVGSISARKNLSRLIEAYSALLKWSPRWKLVIVGPRIWKSDLTYESVQRLALAEHVHFTGYMRDADLPALYNGADLFVFPSLYEGFGLPPLEAMACGTPVVCSNAASLPEVVGDAALTVDPTDVEGLADAMHRVLSDPGLAADLRARGLARASTFTWERTARETVEVYRQVLDEGLVTR